MQLEEHTTSERIISGSTEKPALADKSEDEDNGQFSLNYITEKPTLEDKSDDGQFVDHKSMKDEYGRFHQAVDRIVAEANLNFANWERSLENWTVFSKTKEYTMYTTNDPSNEDILTLRLVATTMKSKGDLLGAFQYMLTSGDMEKHDSYIQDTNVFSTPDGAIKIEHKHLKNPYPFVWARSLLSVRYDQRTATTFSRNFISCDDILSYDIPPKTILGFNRGRHLLIKKGEDYHYSFILQVNPKGTLSKIPMLLKFMARYAGQEVSRAYQMVLNSNLEEPGLVSFKENLRKHGLSANKKSKTAD